MSVTGAHPAVEISDEMLAEQAQKGSKTAYGDLVERYMRRAYSFAYQIVGNMEDARDLSQDVFIKVYQSMDAYKKGSRFFPWFYRILVNHCLNYRRRKKIVNWLSLSNDHHRMEAERSIVYNHDEEYSLDEAEKYKLLHQVIDRLPKKQRMVVMLHGIEGLSQKETAEILGISEGTVRSRFFYAKDRLYKSLKGKLI